MALNDSTSMMDLIERILRWWSPQSTPPPPPPTPAIVSVAPILVPSRCLPTIVLSAVPAPLNPVNAGADLHALFSGFWMALATIYFMVWIRQHLTSLYTTWPLTAMVNSALLPFILFYIPYHYLGHQLIPFERGAILSTIRNDWVHAWPEGITAKSNMNRCRHDLSTLFFRYAPHQIRESLRDEIWTTTSYLVSPVAAMKSRGLLIADLPFIAALLCFYGALFFCVYLAYDMARKNPHQVFCSSISKQDLALAMLPRSLSTHISKHKLFLKRLSRNHCKRSSEPDLPLTKTPRLSLFTLLKNQRLKSVRPRLSARRLMEIKRSKKRLSKQLIKLNKRLGKMKAKSQRMNKVEEEHKQPLEEKAILKLLDNHSPQEIRKAVCNYPKALASLEEVFDEAEATGDVNKELDARNTELLATNAKFVLENMDLKARNSKLGTRNSAINEPDTKIRELNMRLMTDIAKLRITNKAQAATIARLRKSRATKENKQVASDNGSQPASDLGDEASLRHGTGAEAGAFTDSGKGKTVGGVSKKPYTTKGKASPSTGQPENINAVGYSGSLPIDKESSIGRIEGGAPGEEDGKAGSSTDQPQNTNAGGDNDSFPDEESSVNHVANGTTDSQAEKKRRRKKRGGTAFRAAKEAAWARANPGAANDVGEGEATKADGEDSE